MPSAIEIYKELPKTNCKECGYQTCLAFAMALSQQKESISKCPYVKEDVKQKLLDSTRPPIREVIFGNLKLGNETVMFRHENKFVNRTAIGILISGVMEEKEIERRIKILESFDYERVGEQIRLDFAAVEADDENVLKTLLDKVSRIKNMPVMIISDANTLERTADVWQPKRPVLRFKDGDLGRACELAKKTGALLVVGAQEIDDLLSSCEKAQSAGVKDILLEVVSSTTGDLVRKHTIIRRLAVKDKDIKAGYPMVSFPKSFEEACISMIKYSSAIVLDKFEDQQLYPLVTLRQNIFTDPKRPLQIDPGVYEINNAKEGALLLTTNFSLTYFTVSSDCESASVPCRLLVVDTEGQSVLTAFASDKINAEKIAKFIKEKDIEHVANTKTLVIPGFLAHLKGDLEEKSGFKVIVGPKNSSDIKKFLNEMKK